MIKIKNLEVCGWEAAIRGMRNPLNSWDKSDSYWDDVSPDCGEIVMEYHIGPNDLDLATRLIKAGPEHCKFLRMIHVSMDINAPLVLVERNGYIPCINNHQ